MKYNVVDRSWSPLRVQTLSAHAGGRDAAMM